MISATMVSIKVKPSSAPAAALLLLLNPHIAGQPIDANGCLPAGVAQHHLAAAGTAVGEEAHAHDVASELLGGGNLDVDEDPRVEGVWRAQAIKPHAPIADIDDQGLVDVAGLRRAARVAQLDRKSTRLNSSHLGISYAVFCLKKKKQ